jgi:DNA-binding ferritin-like protein
MASEYQGALGWLAALLTVLKSASWMHQTHHWQTRGQSYYGDHLLFDRLYNDSVPFLDQVAERTIGLGSPSLVDPVIQAKHLAWCISNCYEGTKADEGPNGMVQLSLQMEQSVLEAIKVVLKELSGAGVLSDGTENLLQGIADKHEEFVYLLKQRADATPYSYAR